MKGKRIVLSVYVLVILLAFSLGAGQAQGTVPSRKGRYPSQRR